MSDRYIKQTEFKNAVYLPDCPVALEKGAVLLDTKTSTYVLQLKLGNIGTADVVSASAFIEGIDSDGNPAYPGVTAGVAAAYDEFSAIGSAFGSKTLLPVPSNNAAAFRVYVESVKTAAGDTLTFSRDRYLSGGDPRDITAERERAFAAERDRKEREEQFYRAVWRVKWYPIAFIIAGLLIAYIHMAAAIWGTNGGVAGSDFIYMFITIILTIICCIKFYGKPDILSASARMVILLPGLSLIFRIVVVLLVTARIRYFLLRGKVILAAIIGVILIFIVSMILYTLISNRVRKHGIAVEYNDVIKKNWVPAVCGDMTAYTAGSTASAVRPQYQNASVNAVSGPACPNCGAGIVSGTKFCGKCGGRIDG